MRSKRGFDRRTMLRGGLTVTAVGASLIVPAQAGPARATAAVRRRIPEPDIHGTGAWHARPPRRPVTLLDHPPTHIVVHHTVNPGNTEDYSLDRAFQISRDIQTFHMDTRGWIDTGQQFTISRGGHITEGRHRSLEALTGGHRHVVGANVAGHNSEVIGIENEGHYTDADVPPALWDSLVGLVAFAAARYGIGPESILGHRDFNSTACPGDVLYARLPELRRAVGDLLGVEVRQPPPTPLLRPGDTGERVRLAQLRLRAHGFPELPVDGVFGPATRDAVAAFARAHGVAGTDRHGCAHTNERGYLGADLWPLLMVP